MGFQVTEIFSEIDEELRREQLRKIWQRFGGLIIAAAVLVVVAVGGWRGWMWYEQRRAAEASVAFEAAVALNEDGKSADAEAAFLKLAANAPRGYRTLSRLRAAADAAKADSGAAAKIYGEVIGDSSAPRAFQDLARVRLGSLLLQTASYADIKAMLEPATGNGRSFVNSARELLALSAWRANDAAAARGWIEAITNDSSAPATMRSRAEALQSILPTAKS